MFTRNFDNLMFRLMGYMNSTTPTQTTWEDGTNCGYKATNGSYVQNNGQSITYTGTTALKINTASNNPTTAAVFMILGTGTANESYNDYTITRDANLTFNSYTATQTIDNNGNLVITNTKIATNNTSSDVTITEIGIYSYLNSTSSSYNYVLTYRKKLDTPVVVSANGGVQGFELKFTIPRPNMPSAN